MKSVKEFGGMGRREGGREGGKERRKAGHCRGAGIWCLAGLGEEPTVVCPLLVVRGLTKDWLRVTPWCTGRDCIHRNKSTEIEVFSLML